MLFSLGLSSRFAKCLRGQPDAGAHSRPVLWCGHGADSAAIGVDSARRCDGDRQRRVLRSRHLSLALQVRHGADGDGGCSPVRADSTGAFLLVGAHRWRL